MRRCGSRAGCSADLEFGLRGQPVCYTVSLCAVGIGGKFMKYVLGIDVGTGGTRAVLAGPDGGIVSSATCEHVPFASPKIGWAQQDPQDWGRATGSARREPCAERRINPA